MPTTTPSPSRLPLDATVPAALGEVLDAVAAGVAGVADLLASPPGRTDDPRADDLPVDDPADRNGNIINASGDVQAELDRRAHDLFVAATANAPLAALASEEAAEPVALVTGAPYALALDPLDGSSNIGVNAPVGTIFSVLDTADVSINDVAGANDVAGVFRGDGGRIVASGIALYGPRTNLVVAVNGRVATYTRPAGSGDFTPDGGQIRIPTHTSEYAINASNYRYWPAPIRHYVDDLTAGSDGPRGTNANTRWVAAVVADAFRILMRGGIYLYPPDRRETYTAGRLRLLYEGHPIAYLIEAAGGAATDGVRRLLDIDVAHIHQKTPLVFGSAAEVARVAEYHETPFLGTQSPLFGRRGLFRG